MEYNILKYYRFLSVEEYETYCFDILPAGMNMVRENGMIASGGLKWAVKDIVNTYPKPLAKAKVELRRRGLDPGDEEYGLSKILEEGEIQPENGLWTQTDIALAMIELAELRCIEPWIYACLCFNVPPVEYVKEHRRIALETVADLGQEAESPLFYHYEFSYGDRLTDSGILRMKLRDDWPVMLERVRKGVRHEGENNG